MGCIVVCGNTVFLFLGVVSVGRIGEMLCCAAVGIASIISSLTKCDEVWMSCCVRFLVPFNCSWLINVEVKLLFPVLLVNNEL